MIRWVERRGKGAIGGLRRAPAPCPQAFTILEILVVISIIGTLIAILMPSLQACRRSGRNLKCMSQMKNVAFEFRLFADDFAYRSRGNGRNLPEPGQEGFSFEPRQFWLEDFQESLYQVSEFWTEPGRRITTLDASKELLMCPEEQGLLRRRPGVPCSDGAVFPHENVSMGFNRRLHRPGPDLSVRSLTSKVLDYPDVPLALDVDGRRGKSLGREPYYTAPPIGRNDGYNSGNFWFPSYRHRDRLNVAFVGGHVLSTRDPLGQPGFRWSYQPD